MRLQVEAERAEEREQQRQERRQKEAVAFDPASAWVLFVHGERSFFWNDETELHTLEPPAGLGERFMLREVEIIDDGDLLGGDPTVLEQFEADYARLLQSKKGEFLGEMEPMQVTLSELMQDVCEASEWNQLTDGAELLVYQHMRSRELRLVHRSKDPSRVC